MVLPRELAHLVDHHGAGRHVDAHRERLGGEHDLHQPAHEQCFDDFLERRHHAGVVRGDARLDLGGEHRETQCGKVVVGETLDAAVDDVTNLLALGLGRQSDAGLVAGLG